jgi:hypothetical protein
VTLDTPPTCEFHPAIVTALLALNVVGLGCASVQVSTVKPLAFWMIRVPVIIDELNGALLILLTFKLKLAVEGMLEIVRNCCPNELEREQLSDVFWYAHTGDEANRLLKVV